ncbi:hypothetical protein RND81_04G172400 [Saponaria officinalis]|uniref:DUF7746 domain-containing protein n=1 Tax=Saponaria officinalis TaxID=3572 RepID=A0AAW1LIL9_SAPOF
MANWLRKMIQVGSTSKDSNTVQSSEISAPLDFSNWNIPTENPTQIYHIGPLDFKIAFSIRTHEETRSVQSDTETLNLLSHTSVQKYIQNKYRFIHFGLVQVAVKPLVHKGVDSPIYMALRDNRLQSYKDSLLAVVQTNVCNGPVYFNCFPDYTVDLSDPLILESLILDLHVSGNKFKEFAKNFAVVFRIYFRLMSSTVNPKFIHEPSSKEETIFIEVHAKDNKTRSLVSTAKALPWDKITIPEILLIPKEPPTPNMIIQDLDEIEEDDERVLLRFGSFREKTLTPFTPSSSLTPSRKSCSSLHNSSKTPPKTQFTVHNKTPIPEYEATSSPPQSPTASDFQSVNTITKEFEIDKEYLRNDFNSSQNTEKRKWFLSFEKEIKDEIRDIWNSDSDSSEKDSDSEDDISQIKAQFNDDQEVNGIRNRKSWQNVSTRNYYPRPSPPDMQYEERSKFTTHTFSPNVIHEWNIDGKSKYEILNTLQEMGMATAAYKLRENNEQIVFSVLILGFTGQLKNWWDNSLTLESRLEIYNHTSRQINDDNMEVIVNDCCDYLIVVIAMYFIGNPTEELSSQKIILTNLRCPTLGDYRWYKDIFLTYVLRRPDCNEGFWMEKFVSGLPKYFSQRVFRKLKESFANEVIAWQTITYGQLFAFVKQQGLALCEELKLQSKYNSEKRHSRREL